MIRAIALSSRRFARIVVATIGALALGTAAQAQTVFSSAGSNAAAITPTVDAFRSALGALNPNTAGSAGSGRYAPSGGRSFIRYRRCGTIAA